MLSGATSVYKATRGRDTFHRVRPVLSAIASCFGHLPLKARIALFEQCRYKRGMVGIGLRYALLKSIAAEVGDNVAVFPGVFIMNPQNLKVGNNVSIQPMCYLECGDSAGGIVIGNDVSIAHGVTVMATTHTFQGHSVPIRDQPVVSEPVYIADNVWIGAKAVILSGVVVNESSIVGAGAVVTKSTSSRGVYAGVPARLIKEW